MGDYRWTADLILATWYQALHGRPPVDSFEYRVGNSGGGFDTLDFKIDLGHGFAHDDVRAGRSELLQ